MKVWMNMWVEKIVVQFVQALYAFAALVTLISDQVRARRDDRDGKKAVCLQWLLGEAAKWTIPWEGWPPQA